MMKINLGCGNRYLEEPNCQWKNIDISKEVKADEYYDVIKGIKEEDNSVDHILADNLLEHISDGFMEFMNDCHRVLKPGGTFEIFVPDFIATPDQAIGDPTHFPGRLWCDRSFSYFDKEDPHWQRFGRIYGFKGWTVERQEPRGQQLHYILRK